MNDPYPIPPGLSSEQAKAFKDLAETNSYLTQQLKQIQIVVKDSSVIKNGPKSPGLCREKTEIHGAPIKPVAAIRQGCIRCMGGSENGRKPLKRIRECSDKDCPLHPFRMGKNPFDKRKLTEAQRKVKAALINPDHFPDNLSQK